MLSEDESVMSIGNRSNNNKQQVLMYQSRYHAIKKPFKVRRNSRVYSRQSCHTALDRAKGDDTNLEEFDSPCSCAYGQDERTAAISYKNLHM